MSRLQQLERRIDQKLREVLRSSSSTDRRELIEVNRAVLDDVASHVDTLPRGKRAFSYSQIQVLIHLAEPERRRAYEAVFIEADALGHDIQAYFEESRIEFPADLKVEVELVDSLQPERLNAGFAVSYSSAPRIKLRQELPQIRLTLLAGNAEKSDYCFNRRRINIGRLAEILDSDLRIVRRNDLPLSEESAGPNVTVSRTHAHIEFDSDTARFRLFDDGSAYGTTVLRDGLLIPVPKGTSKGVSLEPGDELMLGQVHLRFEYANA